MTDTRLVNIETQLAYQEDSIDELIKTTRNQEKRIAQLESTCQLLIQRLSEMVVGMDATNPQHEKPPHY